MTLLEIRELLKDRRLSFIAAQIGVSRQCLDKIMRGKTTTPSYSVFNALVNYFTSKE